MPHPYDFFFLLSLSFNDTKNMSIKNPDLWRFYISSIKNLSGTKERRRNVNVYERGYLYDNVCSYLKEQFNVLFWDLRWIYQIFRQGMLDFFFIEEML